MLPQETALAEQFISQLTLPFQPEQYTDTYRDQVLALIEKKREGMAVVSPSAQRPMAPVVDLMEALKKSLAAKTAKSEEVAAGTKKKVQSIRSGRNKDQKTG